MCGIVNMSQTYVWAMRQLYEPKPKIGVSQQHPTPFTIVSVRAVVPKGDPLRVKPNDNPQKRPVALLQW